MNKIIDIANKVLTSIKLNRFMPYKKTERRRNKLPIEQQLRKIALAQQKRERKCSQKNNHL